jgi:hypothetical protein
MRRDSTASMQESPGLNRETIGTHSFIPSGFEPDTQLHMQHITDKHRKKQTCKAQYQQHTEIKHVHGIESKLFLLIQYLYMEVLHRLSALFFCFLSMLNECYNDTREGVYTPFSLLKANCLIYS